MTWLAKVRLHDAVSILGFHRTRHAAVEQALGFNRRYQVDTAFVEELDPDREDWPGAQGSGDEGRDR